VTNDDAALGLMGLMVVLARRKETMPEMLMLWPMTPRASATPTRTPNGTTTGGTSEDANHMRNARHNAKTGGGTLSSRVFITMKIGLDSMTSERRG
jgi:hypothetical protein